MAPHRTHEMGGLLVLLARSHSLGAALQATASSTMAKRRIARESRKFRWCCWPRSHARVAAL